MTMRNLVSFLGGIVLFISMNVSAAPVGIGQAAWTNLIAKAVASGKQTRGPSDEDLRYLQHIVPADLAQPHQAEYFTLNGFATRDGNYQVAEISAVSENWQKDAKGNWLIDQVIFVSAVDGALKNVFRSQLVETADGQVLDSRVIQGPGPTDAKEIQNWSAKVNQWLAW
jgi:hypothetical protein